MSFKLEASGVLSGMDADAMLAEDAKTVAEELKHQWKHRTFADLGALIDEREDPSVLFERNWLAQGQSFAIVGSSGIGKSSLTDQMALNWAAGRKFFATPMRPLKTAIIQFEDSDRDLKEQRDGMYRGLVEVDGWTMQEVMKAVQNVDLPTDFIGKSGKDFIRMLSEYQHDCRFDMIFINPLQRCVGGDISDQATASAFAASLDAIMKDPQCPCAIGIDMHTPKMNGSKREERRNIDDYAEYMMAGSHEWTDWCRATLCFLRHGKTVDYFDFKAAKRGTRLAMVDPLDGSRTTKCMMKHTEGYIYWQFVTDPEEINRVCGGDEDEDRKPKKRQPLDIEACARQNAVFLAENYGINAKDIHGKTKMFGDVYRRINNADGCRISRDNAEAVVSLIFSKPSDFGVEVVPNPNDPRSVTLAVSADMEDF